MKEEACCFTGHRDLPSGEVSAIRRALTRQVEELVDGGVSVFYAGGARGFDTLAAETVLLLRESYPHIRLILALPYPQQADHWPLFDRERYESIRQQADEVHVLAQRYDRGCLLMRDRYMVDHAAYCVCYLTRQTGGTAYTVQYARRKGRVVLPVCCPSA